MKSNLKLFSIKDKVVIITGGAGGIGNELAKSMAEELAITYAVDIKPLKKFPKKLQKYLNYVKCDITTKNDFESICKMIFQKHKKIDVLVNGAGISLPELSKKFYPEEKWNLTFNVNEDG